VAEYKVSAVDLQVGDVVDTGDQDWQQVVGVYRVSSDASDDKVRKVLQTLDGRYVLAQLTDIDPVDGGVYFAAGLAMVTGDDESADRTVAEVVSTEDGIRTYLYTKFELVTVRKSRG
jgi:uncharacterized protein YlxP (DUF503 family)